MEHTHSQEEASSSEPCNSAMSYCKDSENHPNAGETEAVWVPTRKSWYMKRNPCSLCGHTCTKNQNSETHKSKSMAFCLLSSVNNFKRFNLKIDFVHKCVHEITVE